MPTHARTDLTARPYSLRLPCQLVGGGNVASVALRLDPPNRVARPVRVGAGSLHDNPGRRCTDSLRLARLDPLAQLSLVLAERA